MKPATKKAKATEEMAQHVRGCLAQAWQDLQHAWELLAVPDLRSVNVESVNKSVDTAKDMLASAKEPWQALGVEILRMQGKKPDSNGKDD